jgi:hypothetical protein
MAVGGEGENVEMIQEGMVFFEGNAAAEFGLE